MNPLHGEVRVSGEAVRTLLRYRLVAIGAFALAVASAALLDRAWHGPAAPPAAAAPAVAVQSAR